MFKSKRNIIEKNIYEVLVKTGRTSFNLLLYVIEKDKYFLQGVDLQNGLNTSVPLNEIIAFRLVPNSELPFVCVDGDNISVYTKWDLPILFDFMFERGYTLSSIPEDEDYDSVSIINSIDSLERVISSKELLESILILLGYLKRFRLKIKETNF